MNEGQSNIESSISLRGVSDAKQLSVSLASLDATIHKTRDSIIEGIQYSHRQIGYSRNQNQGSQVAEEGLSRALVHSTSARSFYHEFRRHTRSSRSHNEAYTMRTNHELGPKVPQLSATESRTARITITRSSYATCGCLDSRQLNFKSPNFLNSILGSLFVGYRASPRSKQTCDNIDCRRDSTTLIYTYIFPQWLLNRVFLAKMVYNSSKGPELCVRVLRVRPETAEIFYVLKVSLPDSSRCEHVQRLLMNGEASVLDVSSKNKTALEVCQTQSLEGLSCDTVRFPDSCRALRMGRRGTFNSHGG